MTDPDWLIKDYLLIYHLFLKHNCVHLCTLPWKRITIINKEKEQKKRKERMEKLWINDNDNRIND